MRFCAQLYRAFNETEMEHDRRDLRNKNQVSPKLTDKEVFEAMELKDVWADANLARTYFYARENSRLQIPTSWISTIAKFDEELRARVTCQCGCKPILQDLYL